MNRKTFEKRLQTVGKRLIDRRSPSSPLAPLSRYKVFGDVAYFTNGTTAIKFLNRLISEDVFLEGLAYPNTVSKSFPDVEKLFDKVSRETNKTWELDLKHLLTVIRNSRKYWEKGFEFGMAKHRVHFTESDLDSNLSIQKGTDENCFNLDYRNLYEVLLLMETIGDTDLTIALPDENTKPMLIKSVNIEAVIAPIRVTKY